MTTDIQLPGESIAFEDQTNSALQQSQSLSVEGLSTLVRNFAATTDWIQAVRLRADQRWYERLHLGKNYDVWLISWMPGQSTGYHDHGESAGAFAVTAGVLEEHRPGMPPRPVASGSVRAFGSNYAHDVRNVSAAPAISIHVYSPPLSEMNEFKLEGDRLVPRLDGDQTIGGRSEWRYDPNGSRSLPARRSIEVLLSAARSRLQRLSPQQAFDAAQSKAAVLVDIRPEGQRATEGTIPGALLVERNVLEWRFDPTCSARLPIAVDYDLQVIVFCSEGYTSSLAAKALQDLGLWRATDVVGGIRAWREQGLPLETRT